MTDTEASLIERLAAVWAPTVWGHTRAEGRPVGGEVFGQIVAGYRAAAMTTAPVVVPRLWPEATVVILATGPSLTRFDVRHCRGLVHERVIAIKDAIRLAPWAPVLYACDARWWRAHDPETRAYPGLKYGLQWMPERFDVQILRATGETGLERDPTGLCTGINSGYQAINLAVHLGARRIVLLGYDMQPDARGRRHWFGDHHNDRVSPYDTFRRNMATLVEPLRQIGVTVINCTPGSALDAFERQPLREALG